MKERFEKLYQLDQSLYIEKAPIVVLAGSLLKDSVTGNVIVQLKYQSLSERVIRALIIDIIAVDVTGADIPEHIEYQYLDLDVKAGQSFGSNKAIVVPNVVARSFKVNGLTVIFQNGEKWYSEEAMQTMPSSKSLESALHASELQKQYRLLTNQKAKYVPIHHKDLWCCSCGLWNRNERCAGCSLEKNKVFSVYDVDTLNAAMEVRLAEEAEQARLEKELKRLNQKKRKRAIMIVTPIAVIVGVILLIVCTKTERIKYKAKKEIEKGNFLAALEVLNKVNGEKGVTQIRDDACNGMKEEIENAIKSKDIEKAMELIELYSEEIRSDLYVTDVQAVCPHENAHTDRKEATCEENGYNKVTCKVCGDVDYTNLMATGHDYEVEVLKEATCTEAGEEKFTCKVCGDVTRAEVVVEHKWEKKHDKRVKCAVCLAEYPTNVEIVMGDCVKEGIRLSKVDVISREVKYNLLSNAICTDIVFDVEGKIYSPYLYTTFILAIYNEQGTKVASKYIQSVDAGAEIDCEIMVEIPYTEGKFYAVIELADK